MNKQDKKQVKMLRNQLVKICEKLGDIESNLDELAENVGNIYDEFDTLADAEQDKFDNLPEGLQESDRGQDIGSSAENLSDICNALDDFKSEISDIMNGQADSLESIINDIDELL